MNGYIPNPKFAGSNIVAAFPQGKPCPIGCNQCYAREGVCYCPTDRPNMPPADLTHGKVVRVNDVGDSNVDRELVVASTECYKERFFNTSIPLLDFPGPVVLTVNPREEGAQTWTQPAYVSSLLNLMAVRIRVSPANVLAAQMLVRVWWSVGVPVLVTHMRYYDAHSLCSMLSQAGGRAELSSYIHTVHIKNESYQLAPEKAAEFNRQLGVGELHGVYECGKHGYCRDCRLCEHLYWLCRRRMEDAS